MKKQILSAYYFTRKYMMCRYGLLYEHLYTGLFTQKNEAILPKH